MKDALADSLTEEQAQHILDMLARKAGAKGLRIDSITSTLQLDCTFMYNSKPFILECKIVREKNPSQFTRGYQFFVPKTCMNSRKLLLLMLKATDRGNDLFFSKMNETFIAHNEMFLKAGTTLEELIVQADLEV